MSKFSLEKAQIALEKINVAIRENIINDPELNALYAQKRWKINLAIAIRMARKGAKLTQEEVAERMCVSKSTVARIESYGASKYSPSIETLCKYARALGYELEMTLVPLTSSP